MFASAPTGLEARKDDIQRDLSADEETTEEPLDKTATAKHMAKEVRSLCERIWPQKKPNVSSLCGRTQPKKYVSSQALTPELVNVR
jgi:hypothetical protein